LALFSFTCFFNDSWAFLRAFTPVTFRRGVNPQWWHCHASCLGRR
jgi:hypothetical protein